jgi:hypothetical protein
MFTNPWPEAKQTWSSHVPVAATDAVVTLAAAANTRHVVDFLLWNYDSAPAAGKITIVFTTGGSVTTFTMTIGTTAGWNQLDLGSAPIVGDENTAVTITLASGAGAVKGELHVAYR